MPNVHTVNVKIVTLRSILILIRLKLYLKAPYLWFLFEYPDVFQGDWTWLHWAPLAKHSHDTHMWGQHPYNKSEPTSNCWISQSDNRTHRRRTSEQHQPHEHLHLHLVQRGQTVLPAAAALPKVWWFHSIIKQTSTRDNAYTCSLSR